MRKFHRTGLGLLSLSVAAIPVAVSAHRIAALTGAVFFALAIATPDPNLGVETPSVSDIEEFYLSQQSELRLAFLLTGLAYTFFLLFVIVLRSEFRRAGDEDGRLAALITGAGLLVAGFHVLGTTMWVAPGLQLEGGTDPAVVGASTLAGDTYRNALIEVSTFWRGLLLAGVALLVLRSRALPRWLGWLAAALSAGALVGSASFLDSPVEQGMVALGFGSYVGFHIWVLAGNASWQRVAAQPGPTQPWLSGSETQPPPNTASPVGPSDRYFRASPASVAGQVMKSRGSTRQPRSSTSYARFYAPLTASKPIGVTHAQAAHHHDTPRARPAGASLAGRIRTSPPAHHRG